MTKQQLVKYIEEYNSTHIEKCTPVWEDSVYYVLLTERVFIPRKKYSDFDTTYTTYYIRKFHTREEMEQYLEEEPWNDYINATAKEVTYDYIVKESFSSLIPDKYYSKEYGGY